MKCELQIVVHNSFHSASHSFHGLMNSINWTASSVWVFIAQLAEHCSENAEATGSNPIEASNFFFSQLILQLLKLQYNCDGHIFISQSPMLYIKWWCNIQFKINVEIVKRAIASTLELFQEGDLCFTALTSKLLTTAFQAHQP